jgi:hypothetical protein
MIKYLIVVDEYVLNLLYTTINASITFFICSSIDLMLDYGTNPREHSYKIATICGDFKMPIAGAFYCCNHSIYQINQNSIFVIIITQLFLLDLLSSLQLWVIVIFLILYTVPQCILLYMLYVL